MIQRGSEGFPLFTLSDGIPADSRSDKVVAGVASFPARERNLSICVGSLLPQVDRIVVYLNGYEHVPAYLAHEKITVFRSQDYQDLNATGKVFAIDWVKPCYYFTCDDDFLYPSSYVAQMIEAIEKYGRRCLITVHGSVIADPLNWYYERFSAYQYQQHLAEDRFVTLTGTGSLAFHTDTLQVSFRDFVPNVMVDLTFGILAKAQSVPLVALNRPAFWLMNTERDGLYQQFLSEKTHHTEYARLHAPWSFASIGPYIAKVVESVFGPIDEDEARRLKLDWPLISAWREGRTPRAWSENMRYMRRALEYANRGL